MVCTMKIFLRVCVLLVLAHIFIAEANPIGVCIRNCSQCKKMFGPYFEGQLCAETCLKYKGKLIPDCEDIDTIKNYLYNKMP